MKKLLVLIITPVILLSCTLFLVLPEQVAVNFADGLENQEIDLLMSAYHDDADFVFIDPDGNEDRLVGKDEIRAGQLDSFDGGAPTDVSIIDWEESADGIIVTYYLIVYFGEMELLNTLELTTDSLSWGIQHQTVEVNN